MIRFRATTALIFLAILLLAAGLRIVGLGSFGLDVDEDLTIQASLDLLKANWDFDRINPVDVQGHARHMPVTYYLTSLSISRLGLTNWGVRLPALLMGLLAVALLFGLGASLTDTRTALLAALFLALTTTAIKYSQTARYLGPSLTVSIAACWAQAAFLRRPGWLPGLLALAATGLMLATNLYLVVLLPFFGLYLIVSLLRPLALGFERRPPWAAPILLLGVAAAGGLLLYFIVFSTNFTFHTLTFYDHPLKVRLLRMGHFLAATALRLEFPLIALGLGGSWLMIRKDPKIGWLLVIWTWSAMVVVLSQAYFTFASGRYVIFTLPFICLLAAQAITELKTNLNKKSWLAALITLAIMGSLLATTAQYLVNGDGRNALRDAYRHIAAQTRSDDVVATVVHSHVHARLYQLPQKEEDLVLLFKEQGDWLRHYPDRRVWILTHSSFDPAYQIVRLVNPNRCRIEKVFPASTRFTTQWASLYLCWPEEKTD